MAPVSGKASASGHITLLFSIHDGAEDPLYQGSRGIGLCIDGEGRASETEVFGTAISSPSQLMKAEEKSPLFEAVVSILSEFHPEVLSYEWSVRQSSTLPQQQGFGLSAAAALSTAQAMQRALSIDDQIARPITFHVAHLVERRLSGGLGDVAALHSGGVAIRRQPGCPPCGDGLGGKGVVEGWFQPLEMLVAWRDSTTRHTSSYIDDANWKQLISASGEEEISPFLKQTWNPSQWPDILKASTSFASESQLTADAGRAELLFFAESAIEQLGVDASAHLCMLGESIVILPKSLAEPPTNSDLEAASILLREHGLKTSLARLSESPLK